MRLADGSRKRPRDVDREGHVTGFVVRHAYVHPEEIGVTIVVVQRQDALVLAAVLLRRWAVLGGLSRWLDPVENGGRITGCGALESTGTASKRRLNVIEHRRLATEVEERQLVEELSPETMRSEAGRGHGPFEDLTVLVEEFLQPEDFTVAVQRV